MIKITRGMVEIKAGDNCVYRSTSDGKWDKEWNGETYGEADEETSILLDAIIELDKYGTNCPSCGCTV